MTEEQKQALIEWLKPQIDELQNVSDEIPFGLDSDSAMHLNTMRVSLTALTAQPDNWKQRAEAAEAKLAELKNNPLIDHLEKCSAIVANWPEWKKQGADASKFTRPAPAADLAELVPDEDEVERIYSIYCTPTLGSKNALRHIRAAILRKIEEAK